MTDFPVSPFGTDITSEDIAATMQQFKGWEDRYRQVIQWGKSCLKCLKSLNQSKLRYLAVKA